MLLTVQLKLVQCKERKVLNEVYVMIINRSWNLRPNVKLVLGVTGEGGKFGGVVLVDEAPHV